MIENVEEMMPDLRFPPMAGSMLATVFSIVKPTGGWFKPTVEDSPDDDENEDGEQ